MSSIKINNNTIYFDSSFETANRDKSWTLNFADITVIGMINKMDGDDDSDFILFLDKTLNKYFLSLTKGIAGGDIALGEISKHFKIELNTIVVDNATVLYPKEIAQRPLYKKSLLTSTKTFLAMAHVADGELSDEVKSSVST